MWGSLSCSPKSGSGVFGCPVLVENLETLRLRNRPALANTHHVTLLEPVRGVVCRELLRAGDELLVQRMHDPPLDGHDHRLVALVADDGALQNSPRHRFLLTPRTTASGRGRGARLLATEDRKGVVSGKRV